MNKKELNARIKLWEAVKKEFNRRVKLYPKSDKNSLCYAIDSVFYEMNQKFFNGGSFFRKPHYGIVKKSYPEMWKYKPDSISSTHKFYWWSPLTKWGADKRNEVIDNIIRDLKQTRPDGN